MLLSVIQQKLQDYIGNGLQNESHMLHYHSNSNERDLIEFFLFDLAILQQYWVQSKDLPTEKKL